ncbi:cytochrome P450 [Nocardia rhamnosiphila]|uniref:Cytochrome P450 n=1 Tax=Nocardia rhamnosiphila TaxID=426716 RepID=A0ABV2WYR4_9NOCA
MIEPDSALSDFPVQRTCPFAPPPQYETWRKESPVKRVRLRNGTEGWVVTRHEDLRHVLSSFDFSTKPSEAKLRPGVVVAHGEDTNLLYMDQPMHSNFRRMLVREFSAKRVNELRPELQAIVDERIDAMIRVGGPLDLVEAFCLPIPSMAICQLIGVPWAQHETFEKWASILTDMTADPGVFASTLSDFNDYVDEVVRGKSVEPGDDILSRLVTTRVRDGQMTHDQVVGFAMLLLIAGHETTATQLGMGFLLAQENPEVLQVAGDPEKHWAGVVEEMLRVASISDVIPIRTSLKDQTIAGVEIKKGEAVISLLAGANFDPEVFPEPRKFDPGRTNTDHVAFAHGLHSCLGQSLARAELFISYSRLFERLPDIRLAVPMDEIEYKHGQFTFGPVSLPVVW